MGGAAQGAPPLSQLIVNFWPQWFRDKVFVNGVWPRSYCAVDTETTGYYHGEDLVTQWGHCLVEDGEVVDSLSLVVDWMDRVSPPDFWVRRRLDQVKQSMELAGKPCHMTAGRMRKEGMKPEKAFEFIRRFTDTIKAKGIPFVLHNHVFDEKMLSANFLHLKLQNGFTFGDKLVDTEAVEKASQIPDNARVHPRRTDTIKEYFLRIKYTRVNGLKSNMDEHCFAKYRLGEKYGIKKEDLHDAKVDSHCCHLLMREFAALVTAAQPPPVYPTDDSKYQRRPGKPPPAGPPAPAGMKRIRGQRRS